MSTGTLSGYANLYLFNSIASYNETLHVYSRGIKHKLTNGKFVSLWHKRLGHISQKKANTFIKRNS